MNIDIDTFFKNSFMIVIDDKKDLKRFKISQIVFRKIFNNVPQKFEGYKNTKLSAANNCMRSHYNLIKFAKESNLPFVVVFESDAYPRDNPDILKQYLNGIPDDADMLILGYMYDKNRGFINKYNLLTYGVAGAHAYIVFQKFYDKYLNYVESSKFKVVADGSTLAACKCIGKSYILDKSLFLQYNLERSLVSSILGYKYNFYSKNNSEPVPGFKKVQEYIPDITKL